ncbi:hypothetical protein ACTFIU_008886 [Dictyostelium citrinum]
MDNDKQESFQSKLEKLMANESQKKVTVEPIHIDSFLNENFYNESFLENCNQLKQQLLNEKSIIIKLLDELNDKSSINILLDDGKKGLNQLKELSEKRKEISLELDKQTKLTSIDNLSKYTNLINQLTRIKKYFQLLLIIHMFYSKVKLCIDQSLLSLSLKPFINLIELQNNLNSLKVPTGPRIIDHEERIDQMFPHLTKVVDHVVGDTCKVLETKMRQALILSLKEINWINISNNNTNNNPNNNNNLNNNDNNNNPNNNSNNNKNNNNKNNDDNNNNNNNTASISTPNDNTNNNVSNSDDKKKNNKNKNNKNIKNKNKKNNNDKDDNSNKDDNENNSDNNNINNNNDNNNSNNENKDDKNNINDNKDHDKDNKNKNDKDNNLNNEEKQLIDKEEEEAKNKINIRDRFISNFTNLTLLQLAVQKYQKKLSDESASIKEKINENSIQKNESNKLWSINLILQPLIKGFKYHFQSERVTNFIEKPEWAIHYVKKMIREYSRYLCMLQDSLEESEVHYIDLHQWFIAGLVETVKNKFRGEIKLFLERPDHYKRYFYHTMEEIVEFQRFLLEEYQYPNPIELGNVKGGIEMGLINDVGIIPVPFSIFQENSIFNRWLNLEIENCDQRFQQLYMNSNDRFQLYYRDEFPDLDQLRPTNSAYELISVLSSLTERYQLLTDVSYQFEFFIQIQINLLLRYKNELKSIISLLNINDDDNLHDLCFIFNSLNYCIKVLKEWDDQLIFIEIYEYMNSEKAKQDEYSLSNSVTTKGDEDYSAFSVMISDYKTLIKSLKKKIIKGLFISFASKINNYLKKGTFSINTNNSGSSSGSGSGSGGLISSSISGITSKSIFSFSNLKQKSKQLIDPSQQQSPQQQQQQTQQSQSNQSQDKEINNEQQIKEDELQQKQQQDNENYTQYDVSNEISNGLSTLRYQLGIIYRSLTPTKLASIWKKLLLKIDKYLFNLLLNYQPKFTENDGKQFSKDIKTCLLIFNTFSNTPENYLKRVLESTILLRMSNQDITTFKNEFSSKLKVNLEDELLQKYKIHNLTNDQISKIINLRI